MNDSLKTISHNFTAELEKASKGKKSSLSFHRNPLPPHPFIQNDQSFQVLVVGGSEYISSRNNGVKQKGTLPLFKTENDFLQFFAQHLLPNVAVVALNFAYPLKPFLRKGLLDGTLLYGTKEHAFGELTGKVLGKTLEEYIFATKKRNIRVSVANDTICLILSGLEKEKKEQLVGGIVGTGINFGFFVGNNIVNLETGNFDKFVLSETGKIIDAQTERPGTFISLKDISGAYLYRHFNLLSKQSTPLFSTKGLSQLAEKGNKIAQHLFQRSASLIACQIAGIYTFKKQKKLTFVMEGSLFWKGWHYKQMVEEYLEKLEVPKSAIRFVEIKVSSIKGAVALVA